MGKEKAKFSLFVDDMILYIKKKDKNLKLLTQKEKKEAISTNK